MENKVRVIAGMDIGNGYVKGTAKVMSENNNSETFDIDMPSTIAYSDADLESEAFASENIKNLSNTMVGLIKSKSISNVDTKRAFFGERAVKVGKNLRDFSIDNTTPKSEDALGIMLILSNIATSAIIHLGVDNIVPGETVEVDAVVSTALPIRDLMRHRDAYINKLENGLHSVIIENFEENIIVNINIIKVSVLPEGSMANKIIGLMGEDILDVALKSSGIHDITADMLVDATNVIGVDIGEGTVNLPVVIDGKVALESSTSINTGYGSILSDAIEHLYDSGLRISSRKELSALLIKGRNGELRLPLDKSKYQTAEAAMKDATDQFKLTFFRAYDKVFKDVGSQIHVTYVYGGGSSALKEALLVDLNNSNLIGDDVGVPVIFLDSSYSRNLNRVGLFGAATNLYKVALRDDSNKFRFKLN